MNVSCVAVAAGLAVSGAAVAQTIAPQYASAYSISNLGSVPGVPGPYGGIEFLDNDTLLIGGAANQPSGAIYAIDVTRDGSGNLTGFTGTAALYATAPNIDGGLQFGQGGVLFYTAYPINMIGQIEPGSTAPDRLIDLTALGVASSTGSLAFVPPGFPSQGRLKIVSYSTSHWYNSRISGDGAGTFDILDVVQRTTIQGGPEGAVYITGQNPLFSQPAVLVSEYGAGRVVAYDIDANADPIPATRRDFITGLSGAEGATTDPVTGQFIFATFGGGNQVIAVRGFVPTACYPNCDGSGTLDVADFGCFLQRYASGDTYANCDGSTTPPVLNIADFTCFLQRFAAGCQ
jgi:hypothetical protein